MDDKTLRGWGIAIGAGAMAVAAGVATLGGQAQDNGAAPTNGTAQVEFLVSFKSGAMADAQALAAKGETVRAEAAARTALARSKQLDGLCFQRFTLGGAETVLTPCAPQSSPAREQERWLKRLRGMNSVSYADADVVVGIDAQKK
jgi:hypothetical protein